ncbi:DUF4197 domain-containing protein [Altererythrobacter lutimaris]|uniref:DUF4197 domain-containing protein n=1 Tax=Altererythrobacter lutimaris TaxID=2743979 RepID=A0A850H8S6_9SPHN|nr:DUF4197 domain-containing protein [Altererythrobacter lutimaris]NVE94273.1 DUF4197 domain-containing protein [Altererythrobacter lutimaris]
MSGILNETASRRKVMAGLLAGTTVLALPACQSLPGFSLTEAIRRLLTVSSENAFARLTAADGFWDDQVAKVGLSSLLGTRGDVLSDILTSALFKDRLNEAFADIAIEGSYRAAPLVADAVRVIGIENAEALVRGGPRAATAFLQGEMGGQLIEAMVPELGRAIEVASDPLVAQLINGLTGTDVGVIAQRLAGNVNDAIWTEIGFEEEAIRRDPRSTNDPLLIGVFGAGAAL